MRNSSSQQLSTSDCSLLSSFFLIYCYISFFPQDISLGFLTDLPGIIHSLLSIFRTKNQLFESHTVLVKYLLPTDIQLIILQIILSLIYFTFLSEKTFSLNKDAVKSTGSFQYYFLVVRFKTKSGCILWHLLSHLQPLGLFQLFGQHWVTVSSLLRQEDSRQLKGL